MSSVWAVCVCVWLYMCVIVCLCLCKASSGSRVKRRQTGAQQCSVATRFIEENKNKTKYTHLIIKYKCENVLKYKTETTTKSESVESAASTTTTWNHHHYQQHPAFNSPLSTSLLSTSPPHLAAAAVASALFKCYYVFGRKSLFLPLSLSLSSF